MDRTDNASFTINFNLPTEAIHAYFEGLAKVESAKHRPSSESSFEWSSLAKYIPVFLPMLHEYMKSQEDTKVKIPKKFDEQKLAHQCVKCDECSEDPDISIVIVHDDQGKSEVHPITRVQSKISTKSSEKSEVCPSGCPVSRARVPSTHSTPKTSTESTEKTAKNTEFLSGMTFTQDSKEKPQQVKPEHDTKKEHDVKTEKNSSSDSKQRRPVYQDGNNVVLDLQDLTSAFGGANSGSITDMMKMFGPMMEGLMGNINSSKQEETNVKTEQDSEKKNVSKTDTSEKVEEQQKVVTSDKSVKETPKEPQKAEKATKTHVEKQTKTQSEKQTKTHTVGPHQKE